MKIYTVGYEEQAHMYWVTVASFLSEKKAQGCLDGLVANKPPAFYEKYAGIVETEVDLSGSCLINTLVEIEDNLSYMYGEDDSTDNKIIDDTRELVLSVISTLKGA